MPQSRHYIRVGERVGGRVGGKNSVGECIAQHCHKHKTSRRLSQVKKNERTRSFATGLSRNSRQASDEHDVVIIIHEPSTTPLEVLRAVLHSWLRWIGTINLLGISRNFPESHGIGYWVLGCRNNKSQIYRSAMKVTPARLLVMCQRFLKSSSGS